MCGLVISAFVLSLLVLYRLAGGWVAPRLPRARPVMGYALGALATFWFLQRLPPIWGG